jgi:C4-dicarboxylate transporter DctM subunit
MLLYLVIGLLVLVLLSLPVAAVLMALAYALDVSAAFMPLTRALGDVAWGASSDFLLLSIPLFVLLGEIVLRAGIAHRMYDAMTAWVSWLPGGLMHSNIAASSLFAATAGSSVATAATVSTIALPQAKKNGYDERLFLGSIAAGGTLGILIPPSVTMIVYGVLTQTSVPRLYMAGLIPGLLLAVLFMLFIAVRCYMRPSLDGLKPKFTWSERMRVLPDLLPPLLLFATVVGSIYAGLASPTEAASLGIIAALGLAVWTGTLSRRMLAECFVGMMKTSAMIMLIVVAAYYLNFVMATVGATSAISNFVGALDMPPALLLLVVVTIFLIVGFFMESLSIMIMLVPIVTPVVVAAGFDPVWFGIVVVLMIETGLITPPVGLNLFVVQNIRGSGPITDVMVGSVPFVFVMLAMVFMLWLFPEIALGLPNLIYN